MATSGPMQTEDTVRVGAAQRQSYAVASQGEDTNRRRRTTSRLGRRLDRVDLPAAASLGCTGGSPAQQQTRLPLQGCQAIKDGRMTSRPPATFSRSSSESSSALAGFRGNHEVDGLVVLGQRDNFHLVPAASARNTSRSCLGIGDELIAERLVLPGTLDDERFHLLTIRVPYCPSPCCSLTAEVSAYRLVRFAIRHASRTCAGNTSRPFGLSSHAKFTPAIAG